MLSLAVREAKKSERRHFKLLLDRERGTVRTMWSRADNASMENMVSNIHVGSNFLNSILTLFLLSMSTVTGPLLQR